MKVKEPLIVCMLYGDPVPVEHDLKEDFANRYFTTNDILIVVDGEWYDGSYCSHFGSHVPDAVSYNIKDEIPDAMPEGKRVFIVCAGEGGNDEKLNAAILKILSWNFSWKDVEAGNYACQRRKNIIIYGINYIAERLDFKKIREKMDMLYEKDCSVKLLTDHDFSVISPLKTIRAFQSFMERSLEYLDIVASYNANITPEFKEAAKNYFPDRVFDTKSTVSAPVYASSIGYCLLKYKTDLPYYSNIDFHDHVNPEGVLLVSDRSVRSCNRYQKMQAERYVEFTEKAYAILDDMRKEQS